MKSKNPPKQLENYFMHVGKVVWAWNHMQAEFFYLFELELDKNDKAAKALWDKCSSDFSQRELLKGLLEGSEDTKYKECINWALREAEKLSSYRNAAVHARILPEVESFLPNQMELYLLSRNMLTLEGGNIRFSGDVHASKDKHASKINGLIKTDKFEDLVSDILEISKFIDKLSCALMHNFLPPFETLPEKPLLKTLLVHV